MGYFVFERQFGDQLIYMFRTLFFGVFLLLTSCGFDESPAEINRSLLPVVANELISTYSSPQIYGLPTKVSEVLRAHAGEKIIFTVGAPNLSSDTGISFYSGGSDRRILAIGLNLRSSKNSYNVAKDTNGVPCIYFE